MAHPEDHHTHTLASLYDSISARYEKAYANNPAQQKSLEWLLSHLPRAGCKILDIGCGTGRPVALALSRPPHHHQVHGIDVSESMLSVARLSAPSASFELTDVRDFQSDSESFDAVTSYFALLVDISQDEIKQIMQNIFTWLRPGGLLVFSTVPADIEQDAQSWLGRRAIFTSLSEEQYMELLKQLGFVVEYSHVENFMPKAVEAGICDAAQVTEEPQLFIYARKL